MQRTIAAVFNLQHRLTEEGRVQTLFARHGGFSSPRKSPTLAERLESFCNILCAILLKSYSLH